MFKVILVLTAVIQAPIRKCVAQSSRLIYALFHPEPPADPPAAPAVATNTGDWFLPEPPTGRMTDFPIPSDVSEQIHGFLSRYTFNLGDFYLVIDHLTETVSGFKSILAALKTRGGFGSVSEAIAELWEKRQTELVQAMRSFNVYRACTRAYRQTAAYQTSMTSFREIFTAYLGGFAKFLTFTDSIDTAVLQAKWNLSEKSKALARVWKYNEAELQSALRRDPGSVQKAVTAVVQAQLDAPPLWEYLPQSYRDSYNETFTAAPQYRSEWDAVTVLNGCSIVGKNSGSGICEYTMDYLFLVVPLETGNRYINVKTGAAVDCHLKDLVWMPSLRMISSGGWLHTGSASRTQAENLLSHWMQYALVHHGPVENAHRKISFGSEEEACLLSMSYAMVIFGRESAKLMSQGVQFEPDHPRQHLLKRIFVGLREGDCLDAVAAIREFLVLPSIRDELLPFGSGLGKVIQDTIAGDESKLGPR